VGVSSLVLDYGGDEAQAIAGLLHDAVEDCGE
jgi:(p)ppGpp synthase/HD superfamily hydrolase